MAKSKETIVIDYNIKVDQLRAAMKSAQSLNAATRMLIDAVTELAEKSGKSFNTVLANMRKIDAEIAHLESLERARGGAKKKTGDSFMSGQPMSTAYDLAAKFSKEQIKINEIVGTFGAGLTGQPLIQQVELVKSRIKDLAKEMKMTEEQIVQGFLKAVPPTAEWSKVVRAAGKALDDDFKKKLDPLNISLTKFKDQLISLASIPMDKSGAAFPQIKALPGLIRRISEESGRSFDDVGKALVKQFGFSEYIVRNSLRNINLELEGFLGVLQRVFGGPQLITKFFETAFGTATAILIFNIQQLISTFFTEALQKAKDFEREMRELRLAESVLSQAGVEITLRDFENMIDRMDAKFKIFAKTDLRNVVSQVATLTQEFNLSVGQIERLTQSILIAKMRFPQLETDKITKDMVSGLIQGRSQAIKLFTPFGEEIVATKAVAMNLAKQNEELTQQQKLYAGIEVIWDGLGSKAETYTENLEGTNELVDMLLEKEWKTAQEDMGGFFREIEIAIKQAILNAISLGDILSKQAEKSPLLKLFQPVLDGSIGQAIFFIISAFNILTTLISATVGWTVLMFSPDYWRMPKDARDQIIKGMRDDFIEVFRTSLGDAVEAVFGKSDSKVAEFWRNIFPDLNVDKEDIEDTPTGPLPPPIPNGTGADGEDEINKITRALNNLMEQLDEVGDRARKLREDFDLQTTRLDYDFLLDAERAWKDFEDKVADIWKDYNNAVAESNADYRRNELDEEAKFLEDLRQLRENFLFDLEDALRERDARQVLRLQRQYEMDKTNLTNEFMLGKKEREAQHKQEMADAASRRDDRLAELKREFDLKRQREKEDFDEKMRRRSEDHEIEMRRLAEETEDKLRKIANSIAEENKMGINGAQALYRELSKYYGVNGSINQMFDYTYTNLALKAAGAYKLIMKYIGMYGGALSSFSSIGNSFTGTGGGGGGGGGVNIPRQNARGGASFANSPTRVTFGEQGPELAMFIPLGQMQGMFGANLRGMGIESSDGAGGKIELAVTLSPDLEARIIQKSLNGVAASLNSVRRSR